MIIYCHQERSPIGLSLQWLLLSGKATHTSHKHNLNLQVAHLFKVQTGQINCTNNVFCLLTWDWQHVITSTCNQYFETEIFLFLLNPEIQPYKSHTRHQPPDQTAPGLRDRKDCGCNQRARVQPVGRKVGIRLQCSNAEINERLLAGSPSAISVWSY